MTPVYCYIAELENSRGLCLETPEFKTRDALDKHLDTLKARGYVEGRVIANDHHSHHSAPWELDAEITIPLRKFGAFETHRRQMEVSQ